MKRLVAFMVFYKCLGGDDSILDQDSNGELLSRGTTWRRGKGMLFNRMVCFDVNSEGFTTRGILFGAGRRILRQGVLEACPPSARAQATPYTRKYTSMQAECPGLYEAVAKEKYTAIPWRSKQIVQVKLYVTRYHRPSLHVYSRVT